MRVGWLLDGGSISRAGSCGCVSRWQEGVSLKDSWGSVRRSGVWDPSWSQPAGGHGLRMGFSSTVGHFHLRGRMGDNLGVEGLGVWGRGLEERLQRDWGWANKPAMKQQRLLFPSENLGSPEEEVPPKTKGRERLGRVQNAAKAARQKGGRVPAMARSSLSAEGRGQWEDEAGSCLPVGRGGAGGGDESSGVGSFRMNGGGEQDQTPTWSLPFSKY